MPSGRTVLAKKVVYRATVETKEEVKSYVGSAGNTFKERFNGHKSSFNSKTKQNTTALAKYIWTLKNSNTDYKLTWEILRKTRRKFNIRNGCELCVLEKIEIANAEKVTSLNKRNELQSKCPHYKRLFFWTLAFSSSRLFLSLLLLAIRNISFHFFSFFAPTSLTFQYISANAETCVLVWWSAKRRNIVTGRLWL